MGSPLDQRSLSNGGIIITITSLTLQSAVASQAGRSAECDREVDRGEPRRRSGGPKFSGTLQNWPFLNTLAATEKTSRRGCRTEIAWSPR
jgi:hypothetical protein